MRAILSDESMPIYPEPNGDSISITTLHKGDELEVGKVLRKKKDTWVEVSTPAGVKGYIHGDTKIFAIRRVEAVANPLEVYEAPDESSPVLTTLPKKTAFTVRGFEKVEDKEFFHVLTDDGMEGYVRTTAKMRVVPEATPGSARKMMIMGGLFAAAAIVIYLLGLRSGTTNAGNTSIFTIALFLLGLFQFGQGYVQYRQAKKDEQAKK